LFRLLRSDLHQTSSDPWISEYADWAEESRGRRRDLYSKLFAVKPVEWSYEHEYRLIFGVDIDGPPNAFFRYPMEAVKSVIIGEKMPQDHRERLAKELAPLHLDIRSGIAKRQSNEFKVSIVDTEGFSS